MKNNIFAACVLVGLAALCLTLSRHPNVDEVAALKAELAEARSATALLQCSPSEPNIPTDPTRFRLESLADYPFTDSTNTALKHVTRQDVESDLALKEKQANGEYILMFESPIHQKTMHFHAIQEGNQRAMVRSNQIANTLMELGVGQDAVEKSMIHREKVYRASLEAEYALQQLTQARVTYDASMRRAMGKEEYQSYVNIEDSYHAWDEIEGLKRFAESTETPFDIAQEQTLAELIQSTQAYAAKTWHGPYDGLPEIAVGPEMVTSELQGDIQNLKHSAAELREKAIAAGQGKATIALLDRYYSNSVQDKERQIEAIRARASVKR